MTGYSLEEILKMTNWEFVSRIAPLQINNRINPIQYRWFEKKRKEYKNRGESQLVKDALEIFGGEIYEPK